jgi:choline dehydrogenase
LNAGNRLTNFLDFYNAWKVNGPDDSKMAVVNLQGKMYKVAGLRVVDASIFPDAVSAAPNPTVIMAAEKIADQIKKTLP